MNNINVLDNITINKIAAGEVVENPSSIVKELVENSIDANADDIIIEIRNGGKKLIRVTDNGNGIPKNEVELAFKRHSTSKISNISDLNNINTLGFRGEALASIVAVSDLEIITRTKQDDSGIRIVFEGGKIIEKSIIGCPTGTTIIVKNLFYNVPARRKFLKNDSRESAKVSEMITNLALCAHNISFKYINNNSLIFKTPKNSNFFNTISSLFGNDLSNSLIKVDYSLNNVTVKGYISNLTYYRGNRKKQITFVNNRYIKSKLISNTISDAYKTLLPIRKHPVCFLHISIPTEDIDINVHPAKTEIRFINEGLMYNIITSAINLSLKNINTIKEINKDKFIPKDKKRKKDLEDKRRILFSDNLFIKDSDNCNNNINLKENCSEFNADVKDIEEIEEVVEIVKEEIIEDEKSKLNNNTILQTTINDIEFNDNNDNKDHIQKIKLPEIDIIGVLFKTYILCQNTLSNEFYIIDQHAAHERINYEKYIKQFENNSINSQELIVPEVIDLSYEDYFDIINNIDTLNSLGFIIDKFGTNSLIIRSIPDIFNNLNIKQLFYSIVDLIKKPNNNIYDIIIKKIIKNACLQSVKAGDNLHKEEIEYLIKDLFNTDNPFTCPHGRPVIIRMKKYEIEKMFERI